MIFSEKDYNLKLQILDENVFYTGKRYYAWAKKLEKINNGSYTIEISPKISEENILKIIKHVKNVEAYLKRDFLGTEEKVTTEYAYTHGFCQSLLRLIYLTFKLHDSLTPVAFTYNKQNDSDIAIHFLIAYQGYYYDINGKHSKEELTEKLKRDFLWDEVMFWREGYEYETDIAQKAVASWEKFADYNYLEDPVARFCFRNITIKTPVKENLKKELEL
jgi:hypothetical protein